MLSTAIQTSLSQLFNLKVEYLTTIIHNGSSLFLIIGNTSLILMDESFETLKSKISFQCIERIIISSKDQYLFQVHFNNRKPNHVPQKMNIHCLERRTIVRLIKYGWKTDYMCKFLEVRELPMYKAGFKDYVSPADMLKPPKVELFKQIAVQGFKTFTHMGYYLTLTKTFSANQTQKGVYEDKTLGAEFILQITEKYPIEILNYVGDRRDLQYYAENYVHSLLQGEHYWFIDSSVFRKRRNLYNDTSEWTGWQVHARTKDRDYIIILQRRKYIPPFFDSFTDFVLTLKAPKGFKSMVHKNEEEEEEQQPEAEEEEEEDDEDEDNEGGKNAAEDYKKAEEQLYLEFQTQNIARDAADTITAIENLPVDPCYFVFLKFLINNLIFDETTTLFLKNKLGIQAQMNDDIKKYFLQPVKALEKGGEGQQLKIFDNFSNFLPKVDGDSKGLRRHFNYKLSRHLGMCFDGGLLPELTLHKFINLMQSNNKGEMLRSLDYFLYCISESQGLSSDLIPEDNLKKVVKITQQKYIFNERVLSTLLEGKIIIDELLKKDNEQYYVDLMVFLIVYGKSTKYSACKHLIDYWADSQNNIPENLINLLKALVAPLLILYQTDNPKLSTMACLCLINMCAVNNQRKRNSQLHYTLKLIFSLMSIVQHIEEFCQKGILEKITHILSQPDIPGAFYSPQAQTMACKIIYRCITKENDFLKQLPILMELAAVRSDIYNTDIKIIDRLKAEALNTIFRILTINKDYSGPFDEVQQTLIPYIIDIVQLEISEPLKVSVVKLMNIMIVKNKQYALKWEKDKIEEHLTKFEQDGIPGSDFLMKELTSL